MLDCFTVDFACMVFVYGLFVVCDLAVELVFKLLDCYSSCFVVVLVNIVVFGCR